MERRARAATLSGFFLLIVAGVLVAINLVAYPINCRRDTTKNERYTLSKGSARLVSEGLKENMKLSVYVTRGIPKYDVFVEELTDLMKEYESASGGKLSYVVIEPKTDKEREAAKDAGLQEIALVGDGESGDSATIARGYMGIVFEYGSERDNIPILSPEQNQGLEFWITNKIRELRDRADELDYRIGVIKKDGMQLGDDNLLPPQRGPGPSMKSILQQAFPFYKVEDVDLQEGDAEIDKDLRGVIILQADKAYNDKELARIDQFMMRGDKALLVIAGAVNMKASDPTMKAELNLRNVDKLVAGYGIEMKKEAIVDFQRPVRVPLIFQGRLAMASFPGVLQCQNDTDLEPGEQLLDNTFAGFFRMPDLGFPFASTLIAHPEKQPEAIMKTVARSSPHSLVETADNIDMSKVTMPKSEAGQRDIAIAVEGKLKSAFAGEKIEGMEIPESSKSPGRVLVISASQFLANPFARAGNPPPMPPQMAMMGAMGGDRDLQAMAIPYAQKYLTSSILALKNMLDWMSNDADLIASSAKLLGDANLTYSSITKPKFDEITDDKERAAKEEEYDLKRENVQFWVQWTMTLLPSLLFVVIGIGRWRYREANRENVTI